MSIQANCPGCGAQISVEESGGQVTCPYCSAHFEVNMDEVQPAFKVVSIAAEPAAEIPPMEPAGQSMQAFDQFSGEAASQGGTVEHPLSGEVGPPVFGTQPDRWYMRRRLWVIVALAFSGAFCLSCLCMIVVIQRLIR